MDNLGHNWPPVPGGPGNPIVGSGGAGVIVKAGHPHPGPLSSFDHRLGAVLLQRQHIHPGVRHGLDGRDLLPGVAPVAGEHYRRLNVGVDRLRSEMESVDIQQAGGNGEGCYEPQLVALGRLSGGSPGGVFQLPYVGEERPVILVNFQVPQMKEHNLRMLFQYGFGGVGVAEAGGDDDGSPIPDHLLRHCLHFNRLRDIFGADHFDIRERLLHIVRPSGRGLIPSQVTLRTNEDDSHLQFFAFAEWLGGGGKFTGRTERTVRPSFVEDLDKLLRRTATQQFLAGQREVGNETRGDGCGGRGRDQRGGSGGGRGLAAAGHRRDNEDGQCCCQDCRDGNGYLGEQS